MLIQSNLATKTTFLQKLMQLFGSRPDDHVRISNKGHKLLNNKELSAKLADAIIKGHKNLSEGKSIRINGEIEATLVTTHVIGTTD